MLRIPYLPGESDMDQLKTIFRALGTPTEDEWPVRHLYTLFPLGSLFSFRVILNCPTTSLLANFPNLRCETFSRLQQQMH